MRHDHPVFAWFYEAMSAPGERLGLGGMRRRLASKLEGTILEVGAGNGLNFAHYPPGVRVLALDPDRYMLRRAVGRARRVHARVMLIEGEGEALPLKPRSVDTIVACLVLCTVPEPAAVLHEMRRVLRPGGVLHFVEHVRAPARWAAWIQEAIDPAWTRMFAGCHVNRDTSGAIERAGFRIIRVKTGAGGIFVRGLATAA